MPMPMAEQEFVTCSQDSAVFWEYTSFSFKRSTQPFSGAGYHVSSACWSASNSKLMVAPKWGDCIAWCEPGTDGSNWKTIWHKDSSHFTCGCLMSNSRYILSGSSDGLIMLWDVKNKSSAKTFEGHTSPVTGVVCSSNDQLVLSGGQDGTLLLHSLSSSHTLQNTVTLSHTDKTSQSAITRLRFSAMDRAMAASASETGCVRLWSVESQRMLHEFPSSQQGSATDLYFAQSNNKLLVSVGQDSRIHFLDIHQRKEVMVVTTPSPLMSVAIMRDGYTVAAGGVDGKLYVYELRAIKSPKHVLDAHQGAVSCIAEQSHIKSSRGSLKKSSSKKSAKESTRQSLVVSSDSLAPGGTPNIGQDDPLTQPDPSSSGGSVISPLPSSIPTVSRVPTGVSQTPFPVPHTSSGVHWAQFTTPAQPANYKDSTGIFSPVDSSLSTPHPSSTQGSSNGKATAAIPPTQRPQSSATVQESRAYPLMSTFVASTPAMQPPPGMSAIFSPLDAATPASLTVAGPAVGTWPPLGHVPSVPPSVTTPGLSLVQPPQNPVASTTTAPLHTLTSTTTSAAAATTASISQTSLLSRSSTESSSSSQQQPPSHPLPQPGPPPALPTENVSHSPSQTHIPTQLQLPTALLPDANVYLQHMEKRICDSIDEQRYGTHRDIFALEVDMFKQFLMLKQQIGTALSVLDEKIEKLNEQNRHILEQLHQYRPKY